MANFQDTLYRSYDGKNKVWLGEDSPTSIKTSLKWHNDFLRYSIQSWSYSKDSAQRFIPNLHIVQGSCGVFWILKCETAARSYLDLVTYRWDDILILRAKQ